MTEALPELVRTGVTGEQVGRAAARLRSSYRAVVRFVPEGNAPRGAARERAAA